MKDYFYCRPQKTEVKVSSSSEEASVEETKVTPPQPLNNNDGVRQILFMCTN